MRLLSASIVTVAVCPTFTLPISDSLSPTTSCIELRLLITAKDELEELLDDSAELLGDELLLVGEVEELLLEELLLDALVVPVAETVSPTSPESVTIVPSSGAYSLVFSTACSSLCTVSLSLLTAALADARFASRVAELTVELDEGELEPSLEPPEEDSLGFGAVVLLF